VIGIVRRRFSRREKGQGLVEFSMILPVVMLLLLGMLEFGFAFDHAIGLGYSTREGARAGSAMGEGSASLPCAEVDDYIVAAVQRVLKSPGSQVALSRIQEIRIFDADSAGGENGTAVNRWVYAAGAGPTVDGVVLDFQKDLGQQGYSACTTGNRDSSYPADSLGVGIRYRYDFVTPLGAMFNIFGPGTASLTMSDRTVMAINPGAN
jgi:Flp pilus assembly protein TadG